MATRSNAAVQASKSGAAQPASRPVPDPGPDLRVPDRRQVAAHGRRRQARVLTFLASACLAIPLVLAAVGHAVVASEQVRSDALQTEIAQALQSQQDYQLQKAELVAPTRILAIAETHLHMVTPTSVTYLPPVNPGESVAQAHEPGFVAPATHLSSSTGVHRQEPSKGSATRGSTP